MGVLLDQVAARAGDWIQTRAGIAYWPLDPRPEEVLIDDIAHSLAMQCRYGGHCRQFYSVAEHSVHVSTAVPPELAMMGLLHDAAEAYVIDVPKPLKALLHGYGDIEERNWRAIAQRFSLPEVMPPAIKAADNAVALAEMRILMAPAPLPWTIQGEAAAIEIRCHTPAVAASLFLGRFYYLLRAFK